MKAIILFLSGLLFLVFQAYMSQYSLAVNAVLPVLVVITLWVFNDYIDSYDLPLWLKWWIAMIIIGSVALFFADVFMSNKVVKSEDGRIHIKHPFYPFTDYDYASGSGRIDTLVLNVGYINDDGDIRPDKRTCYWLRDTAGYSTMYFNSLHLIRKRNIHLWKKNMGKGIVHFIKYTDENGQEQTVDLFEVVIDEKYKAHTINFYYVDNTNI